MDPGLLAACMPELLCRIQNGAILNATQDDGVARPLSVTQEGHLEVAVHSPRMPFGELHVESSIPEFQSDGVYGVNLGQNNTSVSGSGSVTGTNGLLVCSTGTTVGSFGSLQSRKRLRYRPGQGLFARFTAMFPTNAASSILVAGIGTAEAGAYFGFNGTSYGILHVTGGRREIRTLTVTVGSSTTESITITLNNVPFSVPVTNSGSTILTAYQISTFEYTGWRAEQVGSTVIFLRDQAGPASGTYSLSGTTAVGTFAQTLAGVASTDTWIPQSQWNGDKLDGTGPSGAVIDPSKLNVHQIEVQYLGGGTITFKTEVAPETNNPDFVTCHIIKFPNTLTVPNLSQPCFPFTLAAYSAGSTTNVSVASASYSGFVSGVKKLNGNRFTYTASSASVGAAAFAALLTVRNDSVYKGRPNQTVINLLSYAAASKHNFPVTVYLIKNATLVGTPNFVSVSSLSSASQDTSATSCTFSSNEQVISSVPIGDTGNFVTNFADEITLQPGETITLAARAFSGTATAVLISLNTREDQ